MPERAQRTRHGVEYTRSEVRPSTAIIETTAGYLGRDPLDLRPLETYIDPDALDDLFAAEGGPRADRSGDVRFDYHDLEVRVEFDGPESFSVELSEPPA